jgi:hypothetical protein
MSTAPGRRRWPVVFVAAAVLAAGGGAVASRTPKGRRALGAAAARWREMHTPGGGRARIMDADVLGMVAAMQAAGVRTYRFTPKLGDEITIAPFLVEASWPIEVRLEDETVVGYVADFPPRADCAVKAVVGRLSLAHCHL